ncbi:MAG: DUF192 domain-containing protein [Candidatus Micrarchaeota archaeon]
MCFFANKSKTLTIINSIGKKTTVTAEIASGFFSKAIGLMFRKSLDRDNGMLFIFGKEDYHTFWMANTNLALEALHLAGDGKLVETISMEPHTGKYLPKNKSKYVLEVNQGFCKKNNVRIGDKLKLDFE